MVLGGVCVYKVENGSPIFELGKDVLIIERTNLTYINYLTEAITLCGRKMLKHLYSTYEVEGGEWAF